MPYKDVISGAVSKHPDASQLLDESRLERERWHAPKQEPAPHTAFDAADQNCDDIVAVAHSDDEVLDAIRNHRPVLGETRWMHHGIKRERTGATARA